VSLEALMQVIDELADADPSAYADADSIRALQRELSRLESVATQAVACFDASGDWAIDGAKSAGAWLATACRLPRAQARRQVRRGRTLRHLPLVAESWAKGDLGPAHVDALTAVRTPLTEEALARDEEMLVGQAARLRFETFTRALAYWEQLADPDGAEQDDMERRDRRDVYLTPSVGGMWLGGMTFDPVSGAIVSGELERLERELFEADWAKARDELGRDPRVDELCRTSAQRRADALVEMATRSRAMPADGRRPEPLFSVLVGYETLHGRVCELAQGIALTPGSLIPWLEQADIERAVFTPGGRVEVGITSRFFTGATRRAIELRDRECTHPFCDLPADACQIDHILPYTEGGLTTQENGRVLCGFHNRLRNQRPPPPEE
jgi:Domain of unknown function (DUF222)